MTRRAGTAVGRDAMTRRAFRSMRHDQMTGHTSSDDGSTLLLTIFYGFLSLVLILIVVAASSLYLERKRLFTLADSAALVGAEAFALDEVIASNGVVRPALDSRDVAESVEAYLREAPDGGFDQLTVRRAESVDGQSATVTLAAYWRPPMLTLLVPAGVPIEVTAIGRSVFR